MTPRAVILFAAFAAIVAGDMFARFDVAGFKGSVALIRNLSDVTVTMTFAVSPGAVDTSQYDTIELWSLPAVFGGRKSATQVCEEELGLKLTQLVSGAQSGKVESLAAVEYFHRSVAVRSSTNSSLPLLCGTVLPQTSIVTTHRAKFTGPVFGSVWFRHWSSAGVFVFGELVEINSTSSSVERSLVSYSGSNCASEPNLVSSGLRIPNTTTEPNSQFGFMSASTMTSLEDVTLAVVTSGEAIVACASLRPVSGKTVTSSLSWARVRGSFEFSQQSPFDVTKTSIEVTGLESRAAGFHVHKFPVPQRLHDDVMTCAGNFVGGHFNPYRVVVAESPKPGTGSGDQYEIGDLSGKYGTLAGKDKLSHTYDDWNLPLFGRNSIVGRSIVIHNDDQRASRLMCASIGFPSLVTSAVAVFKSPAYGKIYLRQQSGNPESDTMVFLELASTSKASSQSHNWHVHEYPAEDDAYSEQGRCSSTGAHFNPTQVSLAPPYSTECSEANPFRCELGDLSGRLGPLDIATTMPTEAGKFFFTDEYLPLSGPHSVLGRSVTIHSANRGSGRFSCANITELLPVVARTDGQWLGTQDGVATASITVTQHSQFDPTQVSGLVSGLDALASGYHIHEFPIPGHAASGSECSAQSVAGHFNPFHWDISQSPAAGNGSNDLYEVGDLSGKFGLLDDLDSRQISAFDTNLPLHTSVSALGRSIVIHKKENGARWKCANLSEALDYGGHVISATVTFRKLATGTIKLRQVVSEDGGSGLTSVEVEVGPKEGTSGTLQHNWHVHVQPVTDESDCDAAEGHFDPYNSINNVDYATDCNPGNPLYCEVGDLSKKQSRYDIGGGRKLFHDVDTPLHTNYTVLGRSIVFHDQAGASSRFTCANIIPDHFTYTFAFPATATFTRASFIDAVSGSLRISRTRVVILYNLDVPVIRAGCSKVMVAIAGGEILTALQLEQLSSGSVPDLGQYASTPSCVTTPGANVIGQRSGSGVLRPASTIAILMAVLLTTLTVG